MSKIMEKAPNLMVKPDITNAETMTAFYNSIGRPETSEGYKYEVPEGKDMPTDFEGFSKTAHKFGLTNDQFKGILGEVLGTQWEAQDVMGAEQRDAIRNLTKKWGSAYDDQMAQVKNFLRLTDAPEGLVDLFIDEAMSPKEIEWLHAIATQTKAPAELVTHDKEQNLVTPSEAMNRIQEMLNNDTHPYWKASDPRHNDAVQEMIRLQGLAHPDASTSVESLRA